jgi:hypothetical protein
VTSRIVTKDCAVDFSARGTAPKESRAELEHFLRPTKLLPTDGIVKATASEITKGSKTDVEKARAIYEWIVDNTFRNPNTRGGGGDIRFMLESRDLGGKCADQTLHSEHYVPPSLSAPRTHGRLRGKPSKHPSYLQLQVFDESLVLEVFSRGS